MELSARNAPLPSNRKYPLLLADLAWRYVFSDTSTRAIEAKYPTMSLEEICALPVSDFGCTDSGVCSCGYPLPSLSRDLPSSGHGASPTLRARCGQRTSSEPDSHFRQQHEHLLVATRGDMPAPPPHARSSSIIAAPRGEHSEKPAAAYETIERMYPELPKIELFARSRRPGWDAWGNEAPAYDPQDDVTKSFEVADRVICERKANGGPGWRPRGDRRGRWTRHSRMAAPCFAAERACAMIPLDPRQIARILGGTVVSADSISVPGPNHGPRDRSLSIRFDPNAPDGFIVFSHAGDDPLVCKDHVRGRIGLPAWAPRDGRNSRVRGYDLAAIKAESECRERNEDDWKRIKRAQAIWCEAVDPRNTPAEQYLRSRALVRDAAVAGNVLRYHPACPWRERGHRLDDLGPGGGRGVPLASTTASITGVQRVRLGQPQRWHQGRTAGCSVVVQPRGREARCMPPTRSTDRRRRRDRHGRAHARPRALHGRWAASA